MAALGIGVKTPDPLQSYDRSFLKTVKEKTIYSGRKYFIIDGALAFANSVARIISLAWNLLKSLGGYGETTISSNTSNLREEINNLNEEVNEWMEVVKKGLLDILPEEASDFLLSEQTFVNLTKRMALSQSDELKVARELSDKFDISSAQWGEILRGAYVLLEDDGGELYEKWKNTLDHTNRVSSHSSSDSQHAIQGQLVSELLFSKVEYKEKQCTWLQLEANPVIDLISFLRHMVDWANYRITGRNQGPYGDSEFTEANPLLISKKAYPNFEMMEV
jgi:hypothetical protein